MDNSYLAAKPR